MKILERIQGISGGMMLLPMGIAAIMHTFYPRTLMVGNPSTAVFSNAGTMTIVGILLVFCGIQFKPQQLVTTLRRGGILVAVKLVLSVVFGIVVMKLFGLAGFGGISTMALVACITSCNPGMYLALMENYGDDTDISAFALLNLIGLPFIPVCILGFSSGNGIDARSIMATLIPFVVGFLLGMFDPAVRNFSKSGTSLMVPFLGFCLGANIDLKSALSSCGLGLILFLIFTLINNIPMLLVDRFCLKQDGHASAAICCVAGLSITVPQLMAEVDQAYLPYVESARAQIAFAVVASAIVTPVLVKKLKRSRGSVSENMLNKFEL